MVEITAEQRQLYPDNRVFPADLDRASIYRRGVGQETAPDLLFDVP